MNNLRNILLAGTAIALTACGGTNDANMLTGADDPETETFRQALPSAEDVEMTYDQSAGSAQALEGQYSLIAGLTARAVVGTNATMIHHFATMRFVSDLPPTEAGEDYRVWEGEHDDLTIRVRADRSDAPRGDRYEYSVAAKPADSDGDLLPLVDGHVVRFDDALAPRDGVGIVRFHFSNLNMLQPEREIGGTARVAFRKANRAHQVHVRAIDIETPRAPDYPSAAEYVYAVRPDRSGALRWFSNGDAKGDGEPFENVAVHSMWRADKSGVGSAVAFGGSLDVDYWHLAECWDKSFVKGYDALATPDAQLSSGDPASCFETPENLEVPAHTDDLPDEDPEIPGPMAEEGA